MFRNHGVEIVLLSVILGSAMAACHGGGGGGSAVAVPAWGAATPIGTDNSGNSARAQVAMDSAGNAVSVWRQEDGRYFSLRANRYTAASGWGNDDWLETDDGDIGTPRVAVDGAGNAMVVWAQDDGVRFNIRSKRYASGVGWDNGAELMEADDGDAGLPGVAMNGAGNAMVVWVQSDGTYYSVRARRYTAGVGWENAVLLETDDGDADFPAVALDGAGNAVAVWRQFDPIGTVWNVRANRYAAGVGWENAVLIEKDGGDAFFSQIAMDAAGNVVAVWRQVDATGGTEGSIRANRYAAGIGWENAVLIEKGGGDAAFPRVAVNAAGVAMAVWKQHDGTYWSIRANRYTTGSGWGDNAALLETDDGDADSPGVAMDTAGNALAVWDQFDPAGTASHIRSNRYTASAGWGNPVLVETDGGFAIGPWLAMNGPGNAVAVWLQSDGSLVTVRANTYR